MYGAHAVRSSSYRPLVSPELECHDGAEVECDWEDKYAKDDEVCIKRVCGVLCNIHICMCFGKVKMPPEAGCVI